MVALAAAAALVASRPGVPAVAIGVTLIGACGRRDRAPRRVVVVAVLVLLAVGMRTDSSVGSLDAHAGGFTGWARVVDDPQSYPGTTRVIVDIEGKRYEIWGRGRAAQYRLGRWRGGERVRLSGVRSALDAERQGRVAWQHVVGEFELEWVGDRMFGTPVDRASNRVRVAIEDAAAVLPGDDGTLYRGLVIGDDRDQPFEMIDRFRGSGLSHLTAVSGQNVSFVLAAAAPLLQMLRPAGRWAVTLGLIVWFVALTRFEPSIVRAGVMAGLSATAFVLGKDRSPMRILALAVTTLMLIDPLLVASVGFWLSVGATAGVVSVGPWVARRLEWLGMLAMPVGITLGAQVGVVLPAMLVFGRLPLVSIPANLLAVPVAGFVMLYGLPAGLLAGLVPPVAPAVMFPCRLGVRWVDTVSVIGARLEPSPPVAWTGWALIAAATLAIAVRHRRSVG